MQPTRVSFSCLRARPRPSSRPARSTREREESAFTLIEILVVMIIIGIMMAAIVPSFRTAKKVGTTANVVAAAQSYAEAVDNFALDHAGRVPVYGVATDWPSTNPTGGPIQPSPQVGAPTNTYLGRAVPEGIQGPQVDIVFGAAPAANSAPPATGRYGVVRYVVGPGVPAVSYRMEVWPVNERKVFTTMKCYFGTYTAGIPTGVKSCA